MVRPANFIGRTWGSPMYALAKQERIKRAELAARRCWPRVRAAGKRLGRPVRIQATSGEVTRLLAAGHSYRAVGRRLGISLGSVQRLAASA